MDDLRQARSEVRSGIEFKEREIGLLGKYAKAYYSPSNVFNMLFDKISPAFNLAGLAVEIYEKIKSKVGKVKNESDISEKEHESGDERPESEVIESGNM